jgi:hypothetical protein
VVCFEKFIVDMFCHLQLLEEVVQLALHRKEVCLFGMSYIGPVGYDPIQFCQYLVQELYARFLGILNGVFEFAEVLV